jgi:hypothetical protein
MDLPTKNAIEGAALGTGSALRGERPLPVSAAEFGSVCPDLGEEYHFLLQLQYKSKCYYVKSIEKINVRYYFIIQP